MVYGPPTVLSVVMRGLDPRIHDEAPQSTYVLLLRHGLMDCRVKPGNDRGEVVRKIQSGGSGAH
jgi:hypothetical protein